ncbi:MAG TPA: Gfo/Idh/MocA family oxidoreductase, partial [bacterium]|nr:Gfo/Idh/MocA family oxidoreductase [bacterium]
MKKRYVQVGIGGRSYLYSDAILSDYSKYAELVGICDTNQGRLQVRNQSSPAGGEGSLSVPMYLAEDFDRMLAEQKPDVVIVTSMDCTHDDYICRALKAGCDVITEKPMTIDAERCRRILDTVRRTGKKLTVTFNYRYSPPRSVVKQVLMEGTIGRILSVDFFWNLNTSHGADYFRRWHRYKKNSGGLLVHKATHHFDLVNWWLSAVPEEVYCRGDRVFYRPEQAQRYGLARRSQRCLDCPESSQCHFYLDLRAYPSLKELYLDQEQYDGYYRDRC